MKICELFPVWRSLNNEILQLPKHNSDHRNITLRITCLFLSGFSMKCFIADFSRFFGTTVQICLLSDPLGTGHQVQSISQIFLIFFFFFLCGHNGPPSGENTVGISFDGKQYLHIYTKFKKIKQYFIFKLNLQIH